MRRAVFLDRDGIVNRAIVRGGRPYPPSSLDEFEFLPGVEQSVRALRNVGLIVVIVTNQPDVAKGIQRREVVEAMHAKLRNAELFDDIKVCYHVDEDGCDCRKPKPGMLMDAAREWNIDLKRSFMIGDRWRDVAAGKAAGCYTFFIDYKYREQCPVNPDAVVESMEVACKRIFQILHIRSDFVP